MTQLKTDPAKKGLVPLKSIANKARYTGEPVYFNRETVVNPSSPLISDVSKPFGTLNPEGLTYAEMNQAIQQYGSIDTIDVEDFKAGQQTWYETIAKGVGSFAANAVFDTLGIASMATEGIGKTLAEIITGNVNDWKDITNNFTAEDNASLKLIHEASKAANEKLHIYKSLEERGEILPLTLGSVMEAVGQLGHAVPAIAAAIASGGLSAGATIGGILMGLNEAQMEANSLRDEINQTRDATNFRTYTEALNTQGRMIENALVNFDKEFMDYDYAMRQAGLIDPNDKRTPRERLEEAKALAVEQLAKTNFKDTFDKINKDRDTDIKTITEAYDKYARDATNTLFAAEGVVLAAMDAGMGSFYNKVLNGAGNFSRSVANSSIGKRILGDRISKGIASAVEKRLVSSSAEALTEKSFEGIAKKTLLQKVGKRVGSIVNPMLNEAVQEMLQEGASTAAGAYVDDMVDQFIVSGYDYDKVDTWHALTKSFEEGAKGTVSLEGLQQGAIAALSVAIGVTPSSRTVNPITGKKSKLPFKHNLWESWKMAGKELEAHDQYVDDFIKAKDDSTRQKLQETYRHFFASQGLADVASVLDKDGRIAEAQDADLLSLFHFMNASVQLGKTKEAFNTLQIDPSKLSNEQLLELVNNNSEEVVNPDGSTSYKGAFTDGYGRKLDQPSDVEKVREILSDRIQKLNEMWDSFDAVNKELNEQYEGLGISRDQRSALLFMHVLKNELANNIKDKVTSLRGGLNLSNELSSLDSSIKDLTDRQNALYLENDSAQFEEKDLEIRKELEELAEKRKTISELASFSSKDAKIDTNNISENTLKKLESIFKTELKLNPNNQEALEGLQNLQALKHTLEVISEKSKPITSYMEKKVKKAKQKVMGEIEAEIASLDSMEYEGVIDYFKTLHDRLDKDSYGSNFQKEADLYRYDKLVEHTQKNNQFALASYFETRDFKKKGLGLASTLKEESYNLGKAFEEFVNTQHTYNIDTLLNKDYTYILDELDNKYKLSDVDKVKLRGAVFSLINSTNMAFKERMEALGEEYGVAEGPTPQIGSDKVKKATEEKSKDPILLDRKSSNSEDNQKESKSNEVEVAEDSEGNPITSTEIKEVEDIREEIDNSLKPTEEVPEALEESINEEELPEEKEEKNKEEKEEKEESSNKEVDSKPISKLIIPATSEYDKETYNDEHSVFMSPIEALQNKNLDSDTKEMIALVYNELNDKGAFSYLNDGKLEVEDEVFYGIDPSFESKKTNIRDTSLYKIPTVFIYTKDANGNTQVLGELFTRDSYKESNRTIRELAIKVWNESEDKSNLVYLRKEDVHEDLRSLFYVSDITGGIIRYTAKADTLPFDVSDKELIIAGKNKVITRKGLNLADVLLRQPTLNSSVSPYILLQDNKGKYHPASIIFPSGVELFDKHSSSKLATSIKRTIKELIDAKKRLDEGNRAIVIKEIKRLADELSSYIYMGRDTHIVVLKSGDLLFRSYRRNEEGRRIATKNSAGNTVYATDSFIVELNSDDATETLIKVLSKGLVYPRGNNIINSSDTSYSSMFLEVSKANITNPQLGGVFFGIGNIDLAASKRNTGNVPLATINRYNKLLDSYTDTLLKKESVTINKDTKSILATALSPFGFGQAYNIKLWGQEFNTIMEAYAYGMSIYLDIYPISKHLKEGIPISLRLPAFREALLSLPKEKAEVKKKVEGKMLDYILSKVVKHMPVDSVELLKASQILEYKFTYRDGGLLGGTDNILSPAWNRLAERLVTSTPVETFKLSEIKTTEEEDSSEEANEESTPNEVESLIETTKEESESKIEDTKESESKEEVSEEKVEKIEKSTEKTPKKPARKLRPKKALSLEDDGEFRIITDRYAEKIDHNLEREWATKSLGLKIGKDYTIKYGNMSQIKIGDNLYDVQGEYDKKTKQFYVHNDALRGTLFHEAFHQILDKKISSSDRFLLQKFIESSSFNKNKYSILNGIIDPEFIENSSEVLPELFAEYMTEELYNPSSTYVRSSIVLALSKLESMMNFEEKIKAINLNKPVKYRKTYTQKEVDFKNIFVRAFLKLVNAFRDNIDSFRKSKEQFSLISLFRAINDGTFNSTTRKEEKLIQVKKKLDKKLEKDSNADVKKETEEVEKAKEEIKKDTESKVDKTLKEVLSTKTSKSPIKRFKDSARTLISSLTSSKKEKAPENKVIKSRIKTWELYNPEDPNDWKLTTKSDSSIALIKDRIDLIGGDYGRVLEWGFDFISDFYNSDYNHFAIVDNIFDSLAKDSIIERDVNTYSDLEIANIIKKALQQIGAGFTLILPNYNEYSNIENIDLDTRIVDSLNDMKRVKVRRSILDSRTKSLLSSIIKQSNNLIEAIDNIEKENNESKETERVGTEILDRVDLCKGF